uniref:Myb/SANT-like domain-containing protein n=1 Tax=Brassica campestris TaxID=3711 RepID=M4FJ33_BRACM
MTSNHRQSTTFSDEEDINLPTETSVRREDNFKWNPNRERVFIELYDRAISMSDYRFKDPTSAGKEFVVAKFNQMYNISVNYRFFKEKLDQLKRKYKKYKHLMKNSTGISVDPTTSVISASDSWWKDREVDRIVKSFKRKPPELWDVMQRCFVLYDVQSQSQYSLHQRREELLNDGQNNDETETYGGDMQDTQVQETQESEEIPTSRVQQRSGLRRGSSSQRGAGTSRIAARSGSQGSRRKQSFETTLTDTMTGFREFQRQSLQQLRPNSFDEDDYNEFDNAVKIFESMDLPNDTNFYWACIHAFKEERFWPLSGYTPDGEFVGKRLESGQKFGSPTCGQWNSGFQQWGTPPSAPQWGTPPNAPQWSSPSNAPQWGPPPNAPQWGTPPNVPQWGTQPFPQWGAPQNSQQWGSSTSTQQWGLTSAVPQWGSSPTTHQWGSSQDAPQYIPPRNVQHGFSLETEVQTTTREKEVPVSENVIRGVSPEFTNYASTSKASRPRRRGGLFNIWGTERGLNLNETQESDSTSDN